MFGVTAWTLDRRGDDALGRAAELGFSSIHVSFDDLPVASPKASSELRHFADVAAGAGIALEGLAINTLESIGLRHRRKAEHAIARGIEYAAALDIPFVYLPSFHAAEIRDSDDLARTAALLSYAVTQADGTPIVVGSENTLDAKAIRQLFGLVANPRLRLLFDTQNPILWGHDPAALVTAVRHLIGAVVHVKDGSCTTMGNARLGAGASDLVQTLDALRAGGFSGRFVLENQYNSEALERSEQDRAALAAMLAEGGGQWAAGDQGGLV